MSETNTLMTPREVAAAFAVNPKTVTRWANEGKLRTIRTPGGHRRFREADVQAFLSPTTTCAYPDGDGECDPALCPPECFTDAALGAAS